MAIKELAKRPEPSEGLGFNTFRDAGGGRSQGVALTDGDGEHLGIPGNPMVIEPGSTPLIKYRTGVIPEASALLSALPTKLRQIRIILQKSTTSHLYLMLFDGVSVPANGATPDWRAFVPRGGQADEVFNRGEELEFAVGLVAALSTDEDSLQIAGPVGFFQSRRF